MTSTSALTSSNPTPPPLPFIPLSTSFPSPPPPPAPHPPPPRLSYNDRLTPLPDKGLCGDPERFDPPAVLLRGAARLASLLLASPHTVVFTGAGISTSVGIPDFRGPQGLWTLEGQAPSTSSSLSPEPSSSSTTDVFSGACPSYTHMALVALQRRGVVQHVITQNVDNLHVKSGLPRAALSELHGNIFAVRCVGCRRVEYAEEDVGGMGCGVVDGWRCGRCGGEVVDDAVDWSTPLPRAEWRRAEAEMKRASLCLVLGSSLRVQPASAMPSKVRWKRKGGEGRGQLVVVNLQATHVDAKCNLRLWGRVDEVMRAVCERLQVEVEQWRRVAMTPWTYEEEEEDREGEEQEGEGDGGDEEYRPRGRVRKRKEGAQEGAVVVRQYRTRQGG